MTWSPLRLSPLRISPRSVLRRVGMGLGLGSEATLASLADDLAAIHGDVLAITEEDPAGEVRELTYCELAETVARYSAAIAARSSRGEPVVVATPNGVDQLLVSLAAARAGRLPAPVNAQMSTAEVRHVVSDCGASLVVRDVSELSSGKGSRAEPPPAERPDPADIAALFYTSGTTGKPKGAELSHRGLVGNLSAGALVPPVLRGHEILMGLPVAHIMGFVALLAPMIGGVPVYFLDRFSASRVLDVIEERHVAAFIGVPAMYRMLLEAGAEDRDLTSVRFWMSGADVMPADVARRFKSFGSIASLPLVGALGEAAFVEGYGMVEVAGGVAAKVSPPILPLGLGDSLGFRLPGWKFRVVDEDGEVVRAGATGELEVSGPGVLKGYWGDESNSAAVLTPDGWLRTGDLVRSGPFGTVVFVGRVKNVVLTGGYTVYPVEVESDLEEHRDVLEAVVLGVPDARFGESVVAAVRLREGAQLTEDELKSWAESRMARYKAPRHIVFVDELPRTGTRKVQRAKLTGLFEHA
ncbi:MAG: AMP-binding protein [Microthrixaceae bacterium]|nr:AMP-binding protein [Microthrixaceae bacterium]